MTVKTIALLMVLAELFAAALVQHTRTKNGRFQFSLRSLFGVLLFAAILLAALMPSNGWILLGLTALVMVVRSAMERSDAARIRA